MKNIFKSALVVSFCLSITLTAKADESFCSLMRSLLEAAPANFENLKGEAVDARSNEWTSTLILPHATECIIYGRKPDIMYTCHWTTDTPRTGVDQYRALARGVESCFPTAKIERSDEDKDDPFQDAEESISLSGSQQTKDIVSVFTVKWERSPLGIEIYVSSQ